MKKLLTLALALVALATAGVLTFERNAAAEPQLQDYRAGTAGFKSGQADIDITFSSPMPVPGMPCSSRKRTQPDTRRLPSALISTRSTREP
jgi:hypothetical protein